MYVLRIHYIIIILYKIDYHITLLLYRKFIQKTAIFLFFSNFLKQLFLYRRYFERNFSKYWYILHLFTIPMGKSRLSNGSTLVRFIESITNYFRPKVHFKIIGSSKILHRFDYVSLT